MEYPSVTGVREYQWTGAGESVARFLLHLKIAVPIPMGLHQWYWVKTTQPVRTPVILGRGNSTCEELKMQKGLTDCDGSVVLVYHAPNVPDFVGVFGSELR